MFIVLNDIEKPVIKIIESCKKKQSQRPVNPMDMKIVRVVTKRNAVELPYTPGLDVAGTIEMVGSKVTRLKKGDEDFDPPFGVLNAEFINS